MEFTGHVKDGRVVLDDGGALPEGARVRVVVLQAADSGGPHSGLLKFAGIINDLPENFTANRDHYFHGRPNK
jgi:hypothetical protein